MGVANAAAVAPKIAGQWLPKRQTGMSTSADRNGSIAEATAEPPMPLAQLSVGLLPLRRGPVSQWLTAGRRVFILCSTRLDPASHARLSA
jgi:hypothetical protein